MIFFSITMDAVGKTTDAFLSEIGSGKTNEAYESASGTLKSRQTEKEFEATVKKVGLEDYASGSWNYRSVQNGRRHENGALITRSGGTILLHMELLKESGVWRVSSVRAPDPAKVAGVPARALPSPAH